MKITVFVYPNSKSEKVEKIDVSTYKVYVKEPPKENKANNAMIELLANYLKIPKSAIFIKAGSKCKRKIIEVKGYC